MASRRAYIIRAPGWRALSAAQQLRVELEQTKAAQFTDSAARYLYTCRLWNFSIPNAVLDLRPLY